MIVANPHPLALQLKAARRARRMTLGELAEKTGYDRVTISRWERGDRSPVLSRFIDWATALGFDIRLRPGADCNTTAAAALQNGAGENTREMRMLCEPGLRA